MRWLQTFSGQGLVLCTYRERTVLPKTCGIVILEALFERTPDAEMLQEMIRFAAKRQTALVASVKLV